MRQSQVSRSATDFFLEEEDFVCLFRELALRARSLLVLLKDLPLVPRNVDTESAKDLFVLSLGY